MNKKIIAFLAALCLLCAVLSACSFKQSPGLSFAGKDVSITLEENPTTGYTWAVSIDDESILAQKSDTYTQSESDGKVGVGGTHLYVFEAKSPGTAVITFEKGQQWEGGEKATETKTYTVVVNEKGEIEKASGK